MTRFVRVCESIRDQVENVNNGIMPAMEAGIMWREVRVNTLSLRLLVRWTRKQDNSADLCLIDTRQRSANYEFSADRNADPEISA